MAKKKLTYQDELRKEEFRVTVFGSSRVKKSSPEYKQAYKLAKELGKRGIDVVTGGGPGIMEAASKGHKDGRKKGSNTQTIGLNITLAHEQKPNGSLDIVREFDRFSNRLDNFMLLSNCFVFANGGVGTLLEFFYTWQLVQTHKICDIPLILMGDMWPSLIRSFKRSLLERGYFQEVDMTNIFIVKDYKEALTYIDKTQEMYSQGKGTVCTNIRRYK